MSAFRDDLLVGKTAFVAGGTSGINLAIAQRLARAGAQVTVLGRNAEKAQRAAEGIAAAGGVAAHAAADVRDYGAISAALAEHRARFGEIDVLVNGAAGNFPAPALGMSSNGFRAVVEIDLLGSFHGCRAAYEHLRKPGASVINISAAQAFQAAPLQSHVCAAKAGVDMLTRCLAIEWGAAGVRVNSITPGPIDDTEGMRRLAPTDEMRQKAVASVPLGRFGRADEIAELALFLCTESAAYVTGAVLVCDGGHSLLGFGSWAT
ncbi:MAG TPA: SDR family oxidoreductase [Polyangiaceae bacterium]|nr:SDR family oxidoreductase [Polyangiaceae bacterium]